MNNAFYRLPERHTFEQWRQRTPRGFRVAVKMSRYLTHIKRLNDPAEPVARFFGHAEALGSGRCCFSFRPRSRRTWTRSMRC
ncbi:hypothetical protein Rhe02_38520 [Rhizocola hellebori]|uniref:Uncharacterized protein n=1 Tax=Rhizocola hellebori TaxID=1392758 RepID=A0A8J3VGT2_9ACTN|nr:DUF72 domain-containing protein [Rhizocola hellebori]GIH05785.1 hypothetical protein Rhe02_38520 [Rhizocola hellebori]